MPVRFSRHLGLDQINAALAFINARGSAGELFIWPISEHAEALSACANLIHDCICNGQL